MVRRIYVAPRGSPRSPHSPTSPHDTTTITATSTSTTPTTPAIIPDETTKEVETVLQQLCAEKRLDLDILQQNAPQIHTLLQQEHDLLVEDAEFLQFCLKQQTDYNAQYHILCFVFVFVFCLFVCSFVRLFVCSFVRLFVCSFARSFVCSIVRYSCIA